MGFHLESTLPDHVNTPTPNKSRKEERENPRIPYIQDRGFL